MQIALLAYIDVKTILIVDSDLGFAFWLGHALDEAGYYALPAINAAGASKLLAELGLTADLVVINAALPDAGAFIADLRLTQKDVRVIAVLDDPYAAPPAFMQANLVEHKPLSADEMSRRAWVDTVRMILDAELAGR